MNDGLIAIRDLFEAGGPVLWVILAVTIMMWTLILERIWVIYVDVPRLSKIRMDYWQARDERQSWSASRIRRRLVSEVSLCARRNLVLIRAMMAILPLLGLLGTVSGMIRVFEVMAVIGNGNARAMAGGVSQATIPTMAGLVAALSALYFVTFIERAAENRVEALEDSFVTGAVE